jgi:hypothetical protein
MDGWMDFTVHGTGQGAWDFEQRTREIQREGQPACAAGGQPAVLPAACLSFQCIVVRFAPPYWRDGEGCPGGGPFTGLGVRLVPMWPAVFDGSRPNIPNIRCEPGRGEWGYLMRKMGLVQHRPTAACVLAVTELQSAEHPRARNTALPRRPHSRSDTQRHAAAAIACSCAPRCASAGRRRPRRGPVRAGAAARQAACAA